MGAITVECRVCGEEWPDDKIGAVSFRFGDNAQSNIWYCKDNPACIIVAKKMAAAKQT